VAIFHSYALGKYRLVGLARDSEGGSQFVINEFITANSAVDPITDVFVGWRVSADKSYALLFTSATAATQFIQSFRLTTSLAANDGGPGGAGADAPGAENGDLNIRSYDPDFDGPVSALSFGKAIQLIEDAVRALLTSAQNAVANSGLNYDQMVSTAIGSLHKVLGTLLRLFASKMRERRLRSADPNSGNVSVAERVMRATFQLMKKTGTEGVANEQTLRAASGLRRMQVQRMLVEKIHEGFAGSLALSLQLLASLNAIKRIDNKSSSPGRHESACMLQFSATVQRVVGLMKQLADSVTTFGQIARRDEAETAARASTPTPDDDGGGVSYWQECTLVEDETAPAAAGAASLNRLVQRLTSARAMDTHFQKTFITTYQSFAAPRLLFRKLVERYEPPADATPEQLANHKGVQMRIAIVLKYWSDEFFTDFDEDLIDELKVFFNERMRTDHEAMANKLLAFVEGKVAQRNRAFEVRFAVPEAIFAQESKERPTSTVSPLELFNTIDVVQLAQQLTLIDFALYRDVAPSELLQNAWSNKKLRYRAPNLIGLAGRSTSLSFWVATLILYHNTQAQRIAMIVKMISLAEALRNLNNFHSLMAVVSGLNTSPIHRLKTHWAKVPKKSLRTLESLNALMTPDHSFSQYRAALGAASLPALPFVGVHLTDLTFLEDGNPDTVEGGLVNMKKRELVYQTIEQLQRYQVTPYTYPVLEPAATYATQLPSLHEDGLYEISLAVEPRK
jgi:hypothetical protein